MVMFTNPPPHTPPPTVLERQRLIQSDTRTLIECYGEDARAEAGRRRIRAWRERNLVEAEHWCAVITLVAQIKRTQGPTASWPLLALVGLVFDETTARIVADLF